MMVCRHGEYTLWKTPSLHRKLTVVGNVLFQIDHLTFFFSVAIYIVLVTNRAIIFQHR